MTVALSRRRALTVGGAAMTTVLAATLPGSKGSPPDGNTPGDDSLSNPFERIHAAGITGEGVRVGVLDPTGFDPSHPEISGSVAAIRTFGSGHPVVDRTSHGTATTAAFAQLAPDAEFYLATFERSQGFVRAVEWFRRRDLDVLLAPVAAYGTAGTDRSAVFRAAATAVRAGICLVAPTGNAAQGHWEGPFAALDTGRAEARTQLRVRPLSGAGGATGRFVAWLVHRDAPDADLDLALLELTETGDGQQLIALSQATATGNAEKLVAHLDGGTYVLVVRPGDSDTDPRDIDTLRVEVTTPTHRLVPARPAGSIAAPAAAPGVIAVGAVSEDAAAPYSGRGPTSEGRVGVDLVAAPRPWSGAGGAGTSAAAARTAGTIALVRAVAPDMQPSRVRRLLRASAGNLGRDGPDLSTGWGRLDPLAAVQRARTR
ncbi:MAG: S8 family serine peptidase [Halobacteriota archaeon]